jgi:rare lipoprotein A
MRSPVAFLSLTCLCLFAAFSLSSFTVNPKEEYGKAGYYNDNLNGRPTASGEKYDKTALTCSHKSLPFGTKIRVTRIDNQLSVIVRVNDRGPFAAGYVVDLSRRAAEEIGLVKDGSTKVRIEVVGTADAAAVPAPAQASKVPAPATNQKVTLIKPKDGAATDPKPQSLAAVSTQPQTSAASKNSDLYAIDMKKVEKYGFGVQLTTLTDADNMLPVITQVEQTWPGKSMVSIVHNDATKMSTYRVIIGPFSDKKTADLHQKLGIRKGFAKCFVVDLSTL